MISDLFQRAVVITVVVLSSMLFVSLVSRPSIVADPTPSGIASAGLILSAAYGGWNFAAARDHSPIIGFVVGMPLGFLFFQNAYARSASMHDLAQGSARIMAIAAVLAIVAGLAAFCWRYYRGRKIKASLASD